MNLNHVVAIAIGCLTAMACHAKESSMLKQTVDIPGLFTITGSPYRGNLVFQGRPLQPSELWRVLDLDRPGLEAIRAAVDKGDLTAAGTALLAYYRQRTAPGWMTGQSLDSAASCRISDRAAALPRLVAAEEDRRIAIDAEKHIFHILGGFTNYKSHDYGPDIDWDANPVGDIEWPCGMHRLQYWDGQVTRCYSSTGDERWARLWIGLISDWIRKTPLIPARLSFPQSWDAIQVGIRSQRLVADLPYYLNSPACTSEFLVEVLTSLYNHARRVELMPYPNTDNFVMIETLGLASVSAILPEFTEAGIWRKVVLERLTTALRMQVKADGVHGELVPSYHLVITRYYLELMELFGMDAVPTELRDATGRMAEFCLAISAPDRRTFFVGDTNVRIDLRPVLSIAGRLLERPDFLAVATEGKEGGWPKRCHFAFKEGGFCTFRSGWDAPAVWLGLHCGPEPIEPFHSQFDRGTFELMAFGRMLMVDPGVFNYKSGDPGREEFRRTAAHQTLTLNGANAARAGKCLQWREDDGGGNAILTVENASYPDFVHRRTVFFVQRRFFVIVDEALGTAEGEIDIHFQLTPGPAVIDTAAKCARTDFPEGGNVLVWADSTAPVNLESESAWFSPKWFVKEPLPAFRYRHEARKAPARFLTVLAPYEGNAVPRVVASIEAGAIGGDNLVVTGQVNDQVWRAERQCRQTARRRMQ
jgi:heparan-sulfate lyase